ncbi:MAG TPA: response regulator [Acidobacteriota bacterium]|nr:response regulator [Acidobacteriota bacterium]
MERRNMVIVIDDIPYPLESLKTVLKRSGYCVLSVRDGRTGLDLASVDPPDLIMSPIELAATDGIELSRLLRKHPSLNRTPILLVATSPSEMLRLSEAINAGADDCLLPSYSPELFAAKVSRMIARKHTEDGLLHSRETHLAETERLIKIGSFEYNLTDDRWEWSDELYRIVGLKPAPVAPTDTLFSRRLKIEGRQFVREVVERNALDQGPLTRELTLREQNGMNRVFEIRGRVTGDLPLAPRAVIGTVQDITERKQDEDAMRKSRDQMVQLQRMEALGQLAGGVAHDFNNLITAIMGYNELISQNLDHTSEYFPYVEGIKKASERASALTRQLLAFSRQQVLQPRVLNLNSIIDNLAKMLARIIGENIELRTNLASDLGNVEIDPGQVEQVILNLAVNSRDAMPEGGKLVIETANFTLNEKQVGTHLGVKPGDYVVVTVSDTGCGMDEETRTRIFEPFFTTKASGKGTGLGLSTVYGIVKQSGGSVWVYSESGKGTTFKIYLPRTGRRPEDFLTEFKTTQSRGGTETILLVEDDEILRSAVQEVLETGGYRVFAAENGHAAIRIRGQYQERIDLLITDMIMPEMDGLTLSEHLLSACPGMQVLYMSGHSPEFTAHNLHAEQVGHFIQKPFSPAALAQKVREVLDVREK